MASASPAPSLPGASARVRVRPAKTESAAAQIPAFAVPSKIVRGTLTHRLLAASAVLPQRGIAHVGLITSALTCRAAPRLPIAQQVAFVWSTRAVVYPYVSSFAQRTGHQEQYSVFRPEAALPVVTFSSNTVTK